MRYNKEENLIFVSSEELVSSARRELSAVPVFDEDEPGAIGSFIPTEYDGREISLSSDFLAAETRFRLTARAYFTDSGEIHVIAPLASLKDQRKKEVAAQYRGEAFIAAALFAENADEEKIKLGVVYCDSGRREYEVVREEVNRKSLFDFLEKCKAKIITSAAAEIDRVTKRLPSMKSLKFPYDTVRAGQDEFIRAAYRTLAKGGELYTTAPTGTGKTVCALFPAVRALGDGRVDKVFYLTPKTTTAEAARECILRFTEKGASIRSVTLIAKDRLCERGGVCRESKKLCPTFASGKMTEAVMALFDKHIPTVTPADVLSVAEKFTVCPYELSLTYAELCDVIICASSIKKA